MLVRPGRSESRAELHNAALPSFGLRWLWQYFADVPRPQVMECGPLHSATVRVLLARCGKLHRCDLVSPLTSQDSSYWDRSGKTPVFRTEMLLGGLPEVPAGSLSVIFCWQLLDLVPHDTIAEVALRFHRLLAPGGVLFSMLREPRLEKGADPDWRLEGLTDLVRVREGSKPFAYPALSNRELDRLIPTGSVKTFLTRAGWREVLAVK
jgi:hypothetical protein